MSKKAWILWLSGIFFIIGVLLVNWDSSEDKSFSTEPITTAATSPLLPTNGQHYTIELLLKDIFPEKDKAWIKLLRTTNLLNTFPKTEQNPASMLNILNEKLQRSWLRKPGIERYQLSDDILSHSQKANLLVAFQELGLYDEMPPIKEHDKYRKYDCAILLGALQSRVEMRLQYILDLWKQGVRFDRLYVLSGHRKLVAEHEPIMAELTKLKIDRNETNMMIFIVTKMMQEQKIIKENELEIIYVYAPAEPNASRANTTDNLNSWKNQFGTEGTISQKDKSLLLISNQPYAAYQATVAYKILSEQYSHAIEAVNHQDNRMKLANGYDIEMVAPKGKPDVLMASLDTLARELYERLPLLQQRLEQNRKIDPP